MKYKTFPFASKSLAVFFLSAAALQLSQVTAEAQTAHTVTTGDTLYNITTRYNLSVDELKNLNHLSSDTIYLNQQLKINDEADDLSKIESQVSEEEYSEELDSSSKVDNPHDEISHNPEDSTPSENLESEEESIESPSITTHHTVEAGDSLYQIARKYNVSVKQLKEWNNLTSDFLQVGDKIVLKETKEQEKDNEKPEETAKTETYTVKAGDSLWAIANKFGISVKNLRDWNNLTSDFLQVGDNIVLKETKEQEKDDEKPEQTVKTETYIVKAGDSLWAIANKFGVTVKQLKEWNGLTSNFLQVGDKIVLKETKGQEKDDEKPEETVKTETYIVKAGDSPWAIANKFGVTVKQLKEWNGLTSNFLQIGQQLAIH